MGSQYYLNRNLGPYFHLGQGMLSQNPSPLTLLSFLLSPFLSRFPSPSGQSVGIVAVAEDDPRQKRRQLLKRFQTLNTRVNRWTFSSQHVVLYTKNKIPLLSYYLYFSFIISNNITQVHILHICWYVGLTGGGCRSGFWLVQRVVREPVVAVVGQSVTASRYVDCVIPCKSV